MLEQSLPDITGTAAVQALSPGTQILAKVVAIRALSTNVGLVRFGGSAISATRGGFLAAGEAYEFPPAGEDEMYDLSQINILAAATDKVSVAYAG